MDSPQTPRADLPPGWVWTTLGEITQPIEKVDPTQKPELEFIYLDIASIDNAVQRITDPKRYRGAEAPSRARQLVQANDVLFSTVRTYLKNVALVPIAYDGQIASTGFSVLRGKDGVLGQYLFYHCLTDGLMAALAALQRGTSYPAVRDGDVRAQLLPLPPLPEQHRIVAKIEELFSELDAGVAALKRVKAALKRYRASVLKAACEGRLVPTEVELAREEGREYEPAGALLKRILIERRAKWEAEHPGKKYAEPSAPETEGLPESPEGWCWVTVGQLAAHEPNSITDGPFGSNLKTEHYVADGPRVIRLQNIGEGSFKNERAHISESHFESLRRHEIFAGDLVIAALGESLPRACVVPEWLGRAIVKADCVRFRPHPALAYSQYANAALNSDILKKAAAQIIHGVGRPRLNQQEVKSLPLPLPPLVEQRRIVVEVERRLSVVEELEATVAANLARAGRLRQAVLKRAFEGRLVG